MVSKNSQFIIFLLWFLGMKTIISRKEGHYQNQGEKPER